jgi:hypothetical protein
MSIGGGGDGGASTMTGRNLSLTNDAGASRIDAGVGVGVPGPTALRPFSHCLTRFAFNPFLSATAEIDALGRWHSATTCALNSSL